MSLKYKEDSITFFSALLYKIRWSVFTRRMITN